MTKPQPIAEVVVTPSYRGSSILMIMTSNPDADSWVRDNAPEYGILFVPEDSKYRKDFSLHVDKNYKVNEVAAYIRTMGADDTDNLTAFEPADAASPQDGGETEEE